MPQCVFKNCRNNYRKASFSGGISYFRFPADPFIYDEWVSIVSRERREHYRPRKYSVVCSVHFDKSDLIGKSQKRRLTKTAVPKLQIQPLKQMLISNDDQSPSISNLEIQLPAYYDETDEEPKNETGLISNPEVALSTTSESTVSLSDLVSVRESPRIKYLKSRLESCRQTISNKSRKIQNLQKVNKRLVKKNNSQKNVIKILKKQQKQYETLFLDLAKNFELAEVLRGMYARNKNTLRFLEGHLQSVPQEPENSR